MTSRSKLDAQDQRESLFHAADWRCCVCGCSLYHKGTPQLAHRVAQTKARLRAFGEKIMHHPLNLVPVCGLKCNDRCNIGNQGLIADELLSRIQGVLAGDEPDPNMSEEYRQLREELSRIP